MKTVIVTDGKYRMSIAAVRALGRDGWRVVLTQTRSEAEGTPPVFSSRYATATHMIEGSVKDAEYKDRLLAVIKEYDRPVLFALSATTLNTVSRYADEFKEVCDLLVSAPEVLDALNDKETVHARASELGLPVPKQYVGEPDAYPVVIKPHCGEKLGLTAADRYTIANNKEEFETKIAKMRQYDPEPIAQQKVEGDGMGACLLIDADGTLINAVCHRRIREYPITGGPSSCCESFYSEKMIADAYALLSSFGFTGMAMVEYKGEYILEVNPRVWGSYPMTVCCDSHFTEDYARACAGEKLEYRPASYKQGVRMRFTLNDGMSTISHLLKGHFKAAFGGVRDFFAAQEALKAKDDKAPYRKYLWKSIVRR
ncbi:MAG: ATP-grasp domain-containing protein [Clostridia bacterium]|nr:ATP-grasp domain-containing protein [Clostridia bacterium]